MLTPAAISMRVSLFFRVLRDQALQQKVRGIQIIRLKALVQFKEPSSWSKIYEAIMDTGAPVSLIPQRIWRKLDRIELADHQVGGIGPGTIQVKIGLIHCKILDRAGHQTKELRMHAFLARTDAVPLIIGFKDLLDRFPTFFDYPASAGYVAG